MFVIHIELDEEKIKKEGIYDLEKTYQRIQELLETPRFNLTKMNVEDKGLTYHTDDSRERMNASIALTKHYCHDKEFRRIVKVWDEYSNEGGDIDVPVEDYKTEWYIDDCIESFKEYEKDFQ